ncbi:MAG TPA: hypothetical protein VIP10_13185 [Burkholderiaceae bacterium]
MRHGDLIGKLARLEEDLRIHGGNGQSQYAQRLRSEITETRAAIEAMEDAADAGVPITAQGEWLDRTGPNAPLAGTRAAARNQAARGAKRFA